MSQLPRYESYKNSGVEWLGEIPSHWQVKRNIGIFDERKEINQPEMELLSVTIKQGIIQQSEITTKKDSSNEDKTKYKVVEKGDLAYNKMRMWQGAIGASSYDGIVSPAYIILRPRDKTYSRYYHYLYRTPLFIKEANRHSYGLCDDMNSLRYEHFKTIYSPAPPPDDVERITNFLDQKTAEIDEAITKKEQLITLLQEQKAILINQAVTKGLNPKAPMKDSGVEWLGEIPAHWKERKLRYCIDLLPGFAFKSNSYSNKEDDIKLLRGVNVNPDHIKWQESVYWPTTIIEPYKQYQLALNDIVLGMDRPWIKSGIRVAQIQEKDLPCLLVQRIARIKCQDLHNMEQSYVALLLKSDSFKAYFEPMLTGISVPHISPDQIKDFKSYMPDKKEQQEIFNYVEAVSLKFKNLIVKEKNTIKLLDELAKNTIVAITTGQIRV